MRDRDDKLIAESMYFKPSKQVGADIGQHLNVADQLYQALTRERDPSQITDEDIDELVLAWITKQEWVPSDFSYGLSEFLATRLKNARDEQTHDKDVGSTGDAYGRSDTELPFSR